MISNVIFKRINIFILLFLVVSAFNCAMTARSGRESNVNSGDIEKSYSTTIDLSKKTPENLLKVSKNYSSNGKYKQAESLLKKIIAENQNSKFSDEAYYLLGSIYANVLNRSKDFSLASGYFKKVIENLPETDFDRKAENEIERLKKFIKK